MRFYSPSRRGFYDDSIHVEMPPDIVSITESDHAALLAEQAAGKRIQPDEDGRPVAVSDTSVRVPGQVSRFQGRAALLAAGLLEQAEAAVAASEDPLIPIAYTDTAVWLRTSPTIAWLGGQLGLSGAQIDDLFVAAAKITI